MVKGANREVEIYYGIMELRKEGNLYRGRVEWIRKGVTEVNIYARSLSWALLRMLNYLARSVSPKLSLYWENLHLIKKYIEDSQFRHELRVLRRYAEMVEVRDSAICIDFKTGKVWPSGLGFAFQVFPWAKGRDVFRWATEGKWLRWKNDRVVLGKFDPEIWKLFANKRVKLKYVFNVCWYYGVKAPKYKLFSVNE